MNKKDEKELLDKLRKSLGPLPDRVLKDMIKDMERQESQKKKNLEQLKTRYGDGMLESLGIDEKTDKNVSVIFADSPEDAAQQSMQGFLGDFMSSMMNGGIGKGAATPEKKEVIFVDDPRKAIDAIFSQTSIGSGRMGGDELRKRVEREPQVNFMLRCEDLFHKFLKENQGAYTIRALENRIDKIISNHDENEYGRNNLQKILNKMRSNGLINSKLHNGEDHYFVP